METVYITGYWHEQGIAARSPATLSIESDHYTLKTQAGDVQLGSLDDVKVSDRLGNIERKLTLADGSVFATDDNSGVDIAFKHISKANGFLHAIESNLGWAIFALALTVVVGFSFFKWGVPAASHAVAHALPQKIGDVIGDNALKVIDDYLFEPSKLDKSRQQKIRSHFEDSLLMLSDSRDEVKYTLHFRAWGEGDSAIPNALALPSGDIILTDRFVELSENQDEINSVLLHEIGHIEHRHSLEMVVQTTLVTAAIALFTGDASGAADMGIGLGSILVSTNYSRNHESEADQYAFEKMLLADINPTSFADIMARITDTVETEKAETENKTDSSDQANGGDEDFLDYFSTHPSTAQRIEQAKRYAQCYKKGLKICDVL